MDKSVTRNHIINISDRKSITLTGVKKIDNFDDKEFLIETSLGYLIIKGNDLEIIKLDTYQGDVSIKGKINSLLYTEDSKKKDKKDSLVSKLFKWYILIFN